MSQFSEIHPGGLAALLDPEVAGKDATAAFFGLHRQEVLYTPRYAKYKIGQVEGQEQKVMRNESGSISTVPYAEPMWLSTGYKQSPYFKDSHFAVQKAMRKFIDEHVYPDAQACEESGKRMSQKILDMMGENGLHAMRQGPGPHLTGRKLFDGAVQPEEFDYFHEMIINQELSRLQARGYADGEFRALRVGNGSRSQVAGKRMNVNVGDVGSVCIQGSKRGRSSGSRLSSTLLDQRSRRRSSRTPLPARW